MRYYQILILTPLLLMALQCNKCAHSGCINAKILAFENEACSSGASVKEFAFQNQTVYCFNPGLCGNDLAVYVLTENCDTLGFLGGFAGNTSINGEPFSQAVYKATVWGN